MYFKGAPINYVRFFTEGEGESLFKIYQILLLLYSEMLYILLLNINYFCKSTG